MPTATLTNATVFTGEKVYENCSITAFLPTLISDSFQVMRAGH